MNRDREGLEAGIEGALSKFAVDLLAEAEESLEGLQRIFEAAADSEDDDTSQRMTGASVGVAASRILLRETIQRMCGELPS